MIREQYKEILAVMLWAIFLWAGLSYGALVEFLPWCSKGPSFDANVNGIIDGQERGGCNFPDQFISVPGGWSVEVANGILEGYLKVPDSSLPSGYAVVQDPTRDFYRSQIWLKGTFPPGIYEIWALLQFPSNSGINVSERLYSFSEGGADIGTDLPKIFTDPAPIFEWILVDNLTYVGGEKGVFIKSDAGLKFGCVVVRIPNGKMPAVGDLDCPDIDHPLSVTVSTRQKEAMWIWTFTGGVTCTTPITTDKNLNKNGTPISAPIPLKTEC